LAELRVGIAGLGAASRLVLPAFGGVEGVRLAAAADIRPEAREGFAQEHGLPAFATVTELCAADIDAVWIETPNRFHAEHAMTAAQHGKHVIVAKPMATSIEDCDRMISAARQNGVRLLQGHSKVFDPAIRAMAEIARSGRLGRVLQIDTLLFNDWLRRPRLASELDEKLGEGFLLRQAPHLVDIASHIAGARATWVRAATGHWAGDNPLAGNCAALIGFAGGAAAVIGMNGYGYFDGAELTFGIGGFGETRAAGKKPALRRGALGEADKYAAPREAPAPGGAQPFFGLTIVSCENGVLRQSPAGLYLYTDDGRDELALPPNRGRAAELIELRDALAEGRDVFPNGEWGRATLETCLAILRSARDGKEVVLGAL
jgi:phthalate 4,5-cis-dihydrodiol dehydrogenase